MERTYYPPLVDPVRTIALTARESEVLARVMLGWGDAKIGTELGCSSDTAKAHVKKIRIKAGGLNRGHLIALVYSGAVEVLIPVGESYA